MLRPQPLPPIPVDTARVVRAAFRKGHPYLRLADEVGALFTDETFAALFPAHGQPALAPWRLAFVTTPRRMMSDTYLHRGRQGPTMPSDGEGRVVAGTQRSPPR